MRRALYLTFDYVGGVSILIASVVKTIPKVHKSFRLIVDQIVAMGIQSLPIVGFVSFFAGAVVAYEAVYQGGGILPDLYIGRSVLMSLTIELGPLLTALIVAGRVSSSIAAELGTMRVTEQIDALESLAIDPTRFLVLPRVVSGAIVLPLLTIFSVFIGCIGGFVCSITLLRIEPIVYIEGLRFQFLTRPVWVALVKAIIYGLIIAIMGSYHGFYAEGGARGVGQGATRAVVSSCILIIFFDFVTAMTLLK